MQHPIGSDFSWVPRSDSSVTQLPSPNAFFTLCRDSIAAVCKNLGKTANRLWIPDYFCPCTVESLTDQEISIFRYIDNPVQKEPIWKSLRPEPHDSVLAVNYFGVRQKEVWDSWQSSNPNISIIEDHSHDPASKWAMTSQADYAVASLRKTIPIPDGAVVWSPKNHPLPSAPQKSNWTGSAKKLAGMILKHDLQNSKVSAISQHRSIRNLFTAGDEELIASKESVISPWSYEYIRYGLSNAQRKKREWNISFFIQQWQNVSKSKPFKLLFTQWPEGCCPFNPVFQFKSENLRNQIKALLIKREIYPPVHWPNQRISIGESDSLYLLTIPVDYRCSQEEIRRIIKALKDV